MGLLVSNYNIPNLLESSATSPSGSVFFNVSELHLISMLRVASLEMSIGEGLISRSTNTGDSRGESGDTDK